MGFYGRFGSYITERTNAVNSPIAGAGYSHANRGISSSGVLVVKRIAQFATIVIVAGCAYSQIATSATAPSASESVVPAGAPGASRGRGMTLISRGVRSYASSGKASLANDSTYTTQWRSAGVPATLAYDLSTVDPSKRQSIYLVWYNDDSYGYQHTPQEHGYNNLESYTIEANTAAGGSAPPESNWVVLDSVQNNYKLSLDHVVPFKGYNWIRINASASDGSPQNYDIALNMDVYDASNGVTDGWLFIGDSVSAGAMGHRDLSLGADSFTNQVGALSGIFPAEQNGGMPAMTSSSMLGLLPSFLKTFHGKYVVLSLGPTDSAGNGPPEDFYNNMAILIKEVLAADKVPLVPTIPWLRDSNRLAHIPALNAQISKLYAKFPGLIPGPDFYSYFRDHQDLISADNLHPTAVGFSAMRSQWAALAAQSIYGTK
jgi:hypothetical protein